MRISLAVVGLCVGCNTANKPEQDRAPAEDPARERVVESAKRHAAELLNPGQVAPDGVLRLHDGTQLKLSDLQGKQVVLFFYPMDDTPGCRAEAQGFRDLHDEFEQAGALVLGISLQGAESHRAFIEKEQLPFSLVVDDDAAISRAFGVPVRGQVTARQTFLLDESGTISNVWRKVSPRQHAAEVLEAVRAEAASSRTASQGTAADAP